MNYECRPKIEYLYTKLSKIDSKYKSNDKSNSYSTEFEAISLQNFCNIAVTCCSSVAATFVQLCAVKEN